MIRRAKKQVAHREFISRRASPPVPFPELQCLPELAQEQLDVGDQSERLEIARIGQFAHRGGIDIHQRFSHPDGAGSMFATAMECSELPIMSAIETPSFSRGSPAALRGSPSSHPGMRPAISNGTEENELHPFPDTGVHNSFRQDTGFHGGRDATRTPDGVDRPHLIRVTAIGGEPRSRPIPSDVPKSACSISWTASPLPAKRRRRGPIGSISPNTQPRRCGRRRARRRGGFFRPRGARV